jgi:chromosome segregation ATPase
VRLQQALDLQRKAMEAAEAEKSSAQSEQASVESVQQRKLERMQSQQEADVDALEQLERARYELADAIDARNEALNQAEDATKDAAAKAGQVELLNAEIKHLKELVDSKFDGKAKKTAERIQKLESENSKLKLELQKVKSAEERVAELERMVEELNIAVVAANNVGSKSNEIAADEWQKKAQLLEVRLEEAEQSIVLKGESLDSAMKELGTTSNLLQDRECEVAVLQDKVRLMEDEVSRQKGEIDVSGERLDAAVKEATDLWREAEELRLKLRVAEKEKMDALNSDGISEIEALTEQKNQLAKELEASKDELEKVKEAMEGLTSALHEMSAESREAHEKYLTKQDEIECIQVQVEELNMSLKNTKENYEVMLDEANYEKVWLMTSVERMEAEARNAHEVWQSRELSFVNSIKKSEEEIVLTRTQMDKTLEAVKERETEDAELKEKMQQLEAQLIEANKIREEAKAETSQWKEKLLDKENELQNIKQENDDLQAKETAASEKIEELSSMLANVKHGVMTGSNQEEDKEKGGSEEDEPVVVVAKMWENSKYTNYDSSKEKENDGDSQADLESNKEDAALDINGLHTENCGSTSPTKQHQHQKRKPLLKRFGGLLKKKSSD